LLISFLLHTRRVTLLFTEVATADPAWAPGSLPTGKTDQQPRDPVSLSNNLLFPSTSASLLDPCETLDSFRADRLSAIAPRSIPFATRHEPGIVTQLESRILHQPGKHLLTDQTSYGNRSYSRLRGTGPVLAVKSFLGSIKNVEFSKRSVFLVCAVCYRRIYR
jgi:hypothetical protein